MLRKENRFHGSRGVRLAYRGKQVRGRFLSFRYSKRDEPGYRIAIVVSRKVSKSAVIRNRIRRRLYELVRTQYQGALGGYDCIVTVYDVTLATLTPRKLTNELHGVLSKALPGRFTREERGIVEGQKE
ncbi:ribonuclease P protein component [Candidatus Saccharibacteria bacterium]|nr:MAG: ribonuclease P protein component [Candidatus Saccharibacteria bacterium]